MTIDTAPTLRYTSDVKPPKTVQNDVQKQLQQEMLKDSMGTHGFQKQLLSLISSSQPQTSVQSTAQNQLQRGYLDVKI